jgi:RNA polymerase sigma factor (sigma-70 family)
MDENRNLALQIKNGDVAAFEKLFKQHYRKLCCYAEDFMKEKAAAEEIVGDFFLKFWENRQAIEIKESVSAYLYTSIRNNCLKNLEHLKVLQKYRDYATYTLQNTDLLHPTSYPLNDMISDEIVSKVEGQLTICPSSAERSSTLADLRNCLPKFFNIKLIMKNLTPYENGLPRILQTKKVLKPTVKSGMPRSTRFHQATTMRNRRGLGLLHK